MQDQNKTSPMLPEDIVQQLPSPLGVIADALDCTTGHVSNVIHRKSKSERVAKAICKLLEKTMSVVFGDEYATTPPKRGKERAADVEQLKELLRD